MNANFRVHIKVCQFFGVFDALCSPSVDPMKYNAQEQESERSIHSSRGFTTHMFAGLCNVLHAVRQAMEWQSLGVEGHIYLPSPIVRRDISLPSTGM